MCENGHYVSLCNSHCVLSPLIIIVDGHTVLSIGLIYGENLVTNLFPKLAEVQNCTSLIIGSHKLLGLRTPIE